jgi:hypothetical protein
MQTVLSLMGTAQLSSLSVFAVMAGFREEPRTKVGASSFPSLRVDIVGEMFDMKRKNTGSKKKKIPVRHNYGVR